MKCQGLKYCNQASTGYDAANKGSSGILQNSGITGRARTEAHRFLTDLHSRHIPEVEYNVCRPEDYVMEMPQSGERFHGRENMRAFQETHPTPPSSLQVRRVLVKEELWVVEGVIDYGDDGRVFDFVVISELQDGKM